MKTTLGILAFLAVPAAAEAQTEGRVVITTPDQRDHLRKMTEELVRLSRTTDPNAKVDLFLKLGEERSRELERMQEQGKTAHHDSLGRSYDKLVTKGATGAIENGAIRGIDMTAALGRYAQATSKHLAVLQRVLANAPPQARKGLLTALAASQHGHEQAILAHQKGKGKFGAGSPPGRQGGATGVDQPSGGRSGGPGRPGGDGPGKGNDTHGPPPGTGKGQPGGDAGPGKGKDQPGPPPGKGKPEGDVGPGKGKGPGGPPPGKGKDEAPPGPPPGKGKGKGGS